MDENMNLNNMDDIQTPSEENQPVAPVRRRRKRSKWQNFKEAYLPVIIAGAAVVLCVSFIAGSVGRNKTPETPDIPVGTTPVLNQDEMREKEAADLLARAEIMAAEYDYQGAMNLLCTYSGGINTHEELQSKYQEYSDAFAMMVPYNDLSKITNLSFRLLMADLDRSLAHPDHGENFNNNYVTTSEFERILNQLYDNGYMLVSLYDLAPKTVSANGKTTVSQGTIYLPEGKLPLVLTQVGVNYFTYIVDSDGDGLADKNGAGFSSRLVLDENGELTSQMVDGEGNVVTGNFDLVTILNDFIEKHPDFSYRGARATLAVTGYDGLFGYRTDPETATKIGQDYYEQQLSEVKGVINKLRADGYDIACYTYDFADYGSMSAAEISGDLEDWVNEVEPLLGKVDILVYPYDDIGNANLYAGQKYNVLAEYGFTYFISKDTATVSWGQVTSDYARMSRREVTGALMNSSPEWFEDLFDAVRVLDAARNFG